MKYLCIKGVYTQKKYNSKNLCGFLIAGVNIDPSIAQIAYGTG